MDHILNLTWDLREGIVWYSKVLIFPLKFYVNKKTRVSCCSAKAQRLTMHLKSFSCFSRDWLYIVRSVLADKTTLEFALGESTRLINHTTYFVSHCIICFISFQSKARQLPVFHLYESLILANILERCSSRISATVKMSWKRRKIVVDNISYIILFSYIWIIYVHNNESRIFYLEYRHAIHFLYAMTHFHQ